MALLARHRYMISKLVEAFGFTDENAVEEMMLEDEVFHGIGQFFSANGPTKVLITFESIEYQKEKLHSNRGAVTANTSNLKGKPVASNEDELKDRLKVHLHEVEYLPTSAVYFIKAKKSGGTEHYAIDPSKVNDGALTFGVIREPLESLEVVMRCVYKPLIQNMNSNLWGQASSEQKTEFMQSIDSFTRGLQESIRSISGGLDLKKPDERVEELGSAAASDPTLVVDSLNLLQKWCDKIEKYLDDSDRTRWETADSGPDTELDYWRSRMQRLNSITEQLKGKSVKSVIAVLSAASRYPENDNYIDYQRVSTLLAQWREIDVQITEAANEAKDNVKYLTTLERFFDPLYGTDPSAIIDTLPALINGVKMIHTIARYFGTTERVTKLFMKITNQMITTCKLSINGKDPADRLWDKDMPTLLATIEKCLQLNEQYQEQYRETKEKLMTMPKSRQFDFSETQIFGKFDLFSRRLIKLMDMFSTMQQFKSLEQHRFEGLDPLIAAFNEVVRTFRAKGHDLMDFHLNKFDRDYVDFNVRMNELEISLQQYINRSFENIGSIEQSLTLLKNYQAILHRENLRSDLDSKLSVIFNNYGQELAEIELIYEKNKHNPPIARNMPPVAGNITWARHLLRKIEDPMNKFQGNSTVLSTKESKKIIRLYNKVARTLIAFEYLWYEAWCSSLDAAKAGLQATLIIRHPDSGKLFVNFDQEIFQLVREAKCLVKLDIVIPEEAKLILLQEENFKSYYNDLKFMLSEYERITDKIIPVTTKLLAPYLSTLDLKLRPGMVTLTWTSMNIDQYKNSINAGLKRLEEMVLKINDLVENRIQKNLKLVSRTVLVELPNERAVTLDEFVAMQETSVKSLTHKLAMRNLEVEHAVEDLIAIIASSSNLDPTISAIADADIEDVHNHFSSMTYQAYLNCVKNSLNMLKKRTCYRVGLIKLEPFFEVDVQLSVPSVRLSPSLDEIQSAINLSAVAVFSAMKKMWQWKQQELPEKERKSFFDIMGLDIEIIKVVLLLTGAMHGTRNIVHDYLKSFGKYNWLWKEEPEVSYKAFMKTNPSLADFEAELMRFMTLEKEINSIIGERIIGSLKLHTANIKKTLIDETRQWKQSYSTKVHKLAKDAMAKLYEYLRVLTNKLNIEVQSLDTLRFVMLVLKEVREKESSIQQDITPILDMYLMLDHYLPGGVINREEIEQKANMLVAWRKVVEHADAIAKGLSAVQGTYKKQLIWDIREFGLDIRAFRKDFETQGPMIPGIKAQVAIDKLKKFKDELNTRERKMEMYRAGEELFALRPTRFAEVVKTRKDITLIDQLYSVFIDVHASAKLWSALLWAEVAPQVASISDVVSGYDARCKKLPKKLREWQAFDVVTAKIIELQSLQPLLLGLSKPSIKPRHWTEVNTLLAASKQAVLPFQDDEFCLAHIFESGMIQHKEEIEEICDGADKQLQIERRLHELKEQWSIAVFEFSIWKNRDIPVLKAFGFVIEELEEAQLQLQSLLSIRHVAPFRDEVQKFLTSLSDTADTLEMWVKVQMLWTSLESVFLGGDIAKQMPLEAKKFSKINKDWEKLMVRAAEVKLVVACCGNELLRTTLPVLYSELEKCQKSLEGYLEQKRSKFPRFYFVSNPVLLLILSQGSDPQQMQPYYEKVFDSIDRVVHSKADKLQINEIQSIIGNAKESILLSKPLKAMGNIEDWLGELEKEMQRSLKRLCETASIECLSQPLRQFVNRSCGQFALLGLQLMWTTQCQDALAKAKSNKQVMVETLRLQLATLQDLSGWCLEDLGTKINRIKVETLVTIQVHQRDVFSDLTKRFRERKLTDANDFEWLKQTRFAWQANSSDEHGSGACVISICDVEYKYNNEYLGCKERLVITPLTDRCFITLSQAMGMCLGGAPAGPAGTGKTETVKDLGRALGVFVVVTNCTDQQRFTDMARIFKGLCQAGLWGCFDEFNRIELPVLSVVAQQILAITNAKRAHLSYFTFPGDTAEIQLNNHVGYFITMNPGYQGRQELPENLKALFRGVAMMVPDREIIIKVKLCSVGYQSFAELARKFAVLYGLCEQQLSKQKHYDFGLRNILSVLRTAGQIKRNRLQDPEEALLMSCLRDMNLSKLVAQDVPLFLSLISDLFPALGMPLGQDHPELKAALKNVVASEKLIMHDSWSIKVVQLYETTIVRHGIMMVGPAGSGKSRIISCLQDALTSTMGIIHKRTRMNPKAIRAEEMFGETDKMSGEWLDGIFASMWAKFNDRNRKDIQWIVCDGPVDAIWIENLNTVLDDNKILTLANGDRVPMTDNVKLLFEVEDLRNASPATVSRAGIIFVSESDLDWEPVLKSWLKKKATNVCQIFERCFTKYVGVCEGPKSYGHLFHFIGRSCKPVVVCTRVGMIEGCCNLLDALLSISDLANTPDDLAVELERIFLYSLAWAVGGLLETDDRLLFTQHVVSCSSAVNTSASNHAGAPLPTMDRPGDTLFEFKVNTDSMEWERWTAPIWEYPHSIEDPDFSSMLVPTVETTRASYILAQMHRMNKSSLMTGSSGTAKTSTALLFFDGAQTDSMRVKKVCFSSATSPFMLQTTLELELDKRGGKSFGPPGGKKMTVFMDDLNMPEKNSWGDQPTLELVRQLVETSGFCFLDKDKRGDLKVIEDLQYVAAMGHPSGGRQDIPNRLKRHFFVFNMILPSSQAINEIYGQMMSGRFKNVPTFFHAVVDHLPNITVKLWQWMRTKMLPSPTKFHYTFTLRELSRVFQGILRTPRSSVQDSKTLVQLWRHENERVFSDKLTTLPDKALFSEQLEAFTQELIDLAQVHKPSNSGGAAHQAKETKFGGKKPKAPVAKKTPIADNDHVNYDAVRNSEVFFVDFMRDEEYDDDGQLVCEAPKLYELGGALDTVRQRVQMFANKYNEQYVSRQMHIILFDDALKHLMRISRCLGMPKGCILLVGVGGSGKQSLTRLASYSAGHTTFQISITKSYNMNSLLDDIRLLYKACGQKGEKITFLFTDAEIKDESFLEVINSILTTGEVANLIPKDELMVMASELRPHAIKQIPNFVESPDNLVKFFIDRVRSNLHVVLCMSPVSAKFAERARKFPGITAGCTIDWFLAWPKEALIAVSEGYISKMDLDCSPEVKQQLIVHMGMVHKTVVDSCDEYFAKMRRHVYQTPKSFLQFLMDYRGMYKQKSSEIVTKASRVEIGLQKLQSGAKDVEKMKIVLAEEEVKLRLSEEATNIMLSKLETSSMEAKKEADAVSKIKELCQADAERIAGEKGDAEEDLAKAQPFLDEADRAVNSIKPNDLNELKKLGKPSDIIKLIFDCVSLLKMAPLIKIEPVETTLGVGKDKKTFMFLKDSYKVVQGGILADTRFLQMITNFSQKEKDFINDETVELMAPYLLLEGFNPFTARNASRAAEGLCTWCKAMIDYNQASKIVKPKLEALRLAEARLQDAERDLFKAEMRLKACMDVLGGLQQDFDKQLATKRAIEENAKSTRKRMEQATSLITGLAGERIRWNNDREEFAHIKMQLIGDIALACAFVAYCGPFNQDFREYLVQHKLTSDLRERKIPFSQNIDLTDFLADIGTIGDWNLAGLPTDPLSIQNGILVTRSTRFPLLIDPQGQALNWICNYEEQRMPNFGTTSFSNPRFREQVEFCMAEGRSLIVAGVEEELDPLLTPVLEKQIITKGRSKYITMAGKVCDYMDEFMLYLVTRLPNPHFSPEEQSKCTIVDFTVTQKGLEEQLLGRVIQKEQRSLEESLKNVLEEVNGNTKALLRLDQMLLERLSENTGNLLDDEELITVLADTKSKSIDVKEKLIAAAEMRKNINEKREQYRPVATRGSVLYFAIVDMSLVNSMYQTSLDQFQVLFDRSMEQAEKANLASKRVNNIIDTMTYLTYRYINRGLYERDKTSFKTIVTFKILTTAGKLSMSNINMFLRGGSALDITQAKQKPFSWMSNESWLHILHLAATNPIFKVTVEDIQTNEAAFLPWYNENEPEKFPVPVIESRFAAEEEMMMNFYRMLVVRCIREDRTLLAVNDFIRKTETIDVANNKLPAMGPKYTEPVTDTVDSVYREMEATTPVIYLLSAGADPTDSIETLCRRKRKTIECVSMGEGQDVVALKAIHSAVANGSWVLLQNCHLGLEFIDSLEDILLKLKAPESACSPDFRLFITTEPHPKFSIGLLQMATKVTNEPPKGLRAGLQRSYTVIVDQDRLERIESATWRTLLFALCFTHSVVQERRKFGPLGWCVPYEFNDGDLNATIMFLEKHLEFSTLSWSTLQYMAGEVQYGGRITDDMDRRLFSAYTEAWISSHTLSSSFTFNPDNLINKIPKNFVYKIPNYLESEDFMSYIQKFPDIDPPEILGLHPNADLTFRFKEVAQLLDTIVETQPKQSSGSTGGKTREDQVYEKCEELIGTIPADYIEDEYEEKINAMGSFSVPLNIFLYQEVQRLQQAIAKVKSTLLMIMQAIRGEVVVTSEIMESINAVFDARVPKLWLYSPAGDELTWLTPSLGVWYSGLLQRDTQYRLWLNTGRPLSFWMTGFFNPQGFLTAVQQETTRAHKHDNWALDSVVLHAEVTEFTLDHVKTTPREGVYVHGLFMDGAAWSMVDGCLAESAPKKLFTQLPVIVVTAVTKGTKKSLASGSNYGPHGPYDCPVYKYPARTDRYLIFSILLASSTQKPLHWTLRGVALLCATS